MRRNPLASLSLTARICATATTLVVLSLAVTSAVIAVRSSDTAETASMHLARTAARPAVAAPTTREALAAVRAPRARHAS